jgi:hypothetical protein
VLSRPSVPASVFFRWPLAQPHDRYRSEEIPLSCLVAFSPSTSVIFASYERAQKLNIKAATFSVVIVSGRRLVLTNEFLLKACFRQAPANIRFFHREFRRYGNISVEGRQRKLVKVSGAGIQAIQTMRPASNQYQLIEPWVESLMNFENGSNSGPCSTVMIPIPPRAQ